MGELLPRMLGERYRLDSVLGEGGMGVVYAAFDLTIERPVAVKLLRPEATASPEEAKRLLREVRSMAQVKSPHSVALFDAGETEDGAPFLVMELLAGEPLHKVLAREGRLPSARAVGIALQACEALSAAHAAGIVHRDVKPANIMVSPPASDGEGVRSPWAEKVTLLDFGVAKDAHPTSPATALTAAGTLVGTLEYMAPEQIAGEAIDGRVDQYALAATLLKMMSGETLFPGSSVASIVHHQLMTVPRSLAARVPDAPAALDAVLQRALQKKPEDRYPDIAAFAAALRGEAGAAAAQGVLAAPMPLPTSRASSFGQPRELEPAPPDGLVLEVDAPALPPAPAAPTFLAPPVRPPPRELAPLDPRAEAVAAWLAPWVWKRVVLYSAILMVLGNGCIRGFSTKWTVVSGLGVVLGSVALLLHASLTRRRL